MKYLCHTQQVFLTYHKILRYGANYPPKEVMLRIFIAIKNPPSSAGFEPAMLGSIGKHTDH
jgi:hypothetical protein